jgi:hypothetical protein
MMAAEYFSHDDFTKFKEYLNNKIKSFKNGCQLAELVDYAHEVWKCGTKLSCTLPIGARFNSMNMALLEASALFNCASLKLMTNATDKVIKFIEIAKIAISRYYVPNLYHRSFYLDYPQINVKDLETYDKYISTVHPKIKELQMVEVNGQYVQSSFVQLFYSLKIPSNDS